MDVVIDTSVLVATIVGEPEKDHIVGLTSGHTLIGPGSIPWEVGHAFSAMFKQNRLTLEEAHQGLVIFQNIPVRYLSPDFSHVITVRCPIH
jgi:predicted nucleic acid-binding protein